LEEGDYYEGSPHTSGMDDVKRRPTRAISIIAPAIFLDLIATLGLFAFKAQIPINSVSFAATFALLALLTIPAAAGLLRLVQRQQHNLEQSSVLLRSVTEHAIFMLDTEGRVTTWNLGAENVKGYQADEIIGQPLSVFYTEEDRTAGLPQHHLAEVTSTGHLEYQGWRVRRDGTQFWANVTLNAIRDEEDTLVGFSKVTQDRTTTREAETRIEALNQQLKAQLDELREAHAQLEHGNRQLAAVNTAISAISGSLGPDDGVLQRIVDAARELVGAQYGALGVADDEGTITQFITSGISADQRQSIGLLPQGRGLLGALIREDQPLRVSDIDQDTRSSGFPPNHPPMTSLLGMPVKHQGRTIGDLYVTDKCDETEFTDEDEELLSLLSGHAAIAITNARLYREASEARDALQRWNAHLEETVAARTRDVERYSHEMASRILNAQESERKRIARELHDETAQSLATLLINVDMLEPQIPEGLTQVHEGLGRLRMLGRRTLEETRTLSHNLRPTILDDAGLVAALNWLADEWMHSFPASVQIDSEGFSSSDCTPDLELTIFRITQEALANVGKHAGAKHVRVELTSDEEEIGLTVVDDGVGFDPDANRAPRPDGGFGVFGMRERTELAGGTFEVRSRLGEGTTISAQLAAGHGTRDAADHRSR
jgi:PAS domain S-box-containing protein